MNESKAAQSETNAEDVNELPVSTKSQPQVVNDDADMPPLESTSSTEPPMSSANESSNDSLESKQRPHESKSDDDDDDNDIHKKVALGLLLARITNDVVRSMRSSQGLERIAPKFLKLLCTHNSVCEKSIDKKDDSIPIIGDMITTSEAYWREIEAFLEAKCCDLNDKVGIFFFGKYVKQIEDGLAIEHVTRYVKQIWSAYSVGLQYRVASLIMKELN